MKRKVGGSEEEKKRRATAAEAKEKEKRDCKKRHTKKERAGSEGKRRTNDGGSRTSRTAGSKLPHEEGHRPQGNSRKQRKMEEGATEARRGNQKQNPKSKTSAEKTRNCREYPKRFERRLPVSQSS